MALPVTGLPGNILSSDSHRPFGCRHYCVDKQAGRCPDIPEPILSSQRPLHMGSHTLMGGVLRPLYLRVPAESVHLRTGSPACHLPDNGMKCSVSPGDLYAKIYNQTYKGKKLIQGLKINT